MNSEGMPLAEVGSVIGGKYRVDAELGRGGMGRVVRATHLHLNQSLAIKLMLRATRPGATARFEREARTTMRLRSEHTVRVFDAGIHDGMPYLVMELLEGLDLRRLIHERGALPVDEAAGYVLQACEALSEAHSLGIVHRDIKPANLFLTRRFDGSPLIKVLDFGVAKECSEEADREALTTSAVSLGSPMYMSPEQVRDARTVDARADVWSAGVTLFELLTGRGPFEAATVSGLLAAVLSDEPTPLHTLCPSAPAELGRIIRSCLAHNPGRRCPSAAALGAALGPFAAPWAQSSLARLSSPSDLTIPGVEGPSFPEATAATLSRTESIAPAPPAPRRIRQPARAFALLALCAGAAVPGALSLRRPPQAAQATAPAASAELPAGALADATPGPAASPAPTATSLPAASQTAAPQTAAPQTAAPQTAAPQTATPPAITPEARLPKPTTPARAQARPTQVKVDDELGF